MYKRILLASDGSANAGGGLELVIALCSQFHAEMTMLLFARTPAVTVLMSEVDEAKMAAEIKSSFLTSIAQQHADDAHVPFHAHLLFGPFVERTLEFMEQRPHDLLVVGGRGHHTILNSLFPTTIEQLVRRAPCSVLVVKGS
jgi:universal stress protein A